MNVAGDRTVLFAWKGYRYGVETGPIDPDAGPHRLTRRGDTRMRGLNSKRLLAAGASLVLVLGVAACGDDDDDDGGGGGETQLDLVIGDSLPLTGDLSPFGPPGQKAADVAKAEIDAA